MAKTEKIKPDTMFKNFQGISPDSRKYQCDLCGNTMELHSPQPIKKILRCWDCRARRGDTVNAADYESTR